MQRFDRRSFLARVVGGAALGAVGVFATRTRAAGQTDTPYRIPDTPPPSAAQRGCILGRDSDINPGDTSGCRYGPNRTVGPQAPQQSGAPTGVSDRDPTDQRGYGRGAPARAHTGRSDQDPSDQAGYGL